MELDFDHQTRADHALAVPGVTRAGDRTVAYQPADGLAFLGTFRTIMKAAAIRMAP